SPVDGWLQSGRNWSIRRRGVVHQDEETCDLEAHFIVAVGTEKRPPGGQTRMLFAAPQNDRRLLVASDARRIHLKRHLVSPIVTAGVKMLKRPE
ncbi:MAG TPA: hypothetical protein VJO72_17110, partial [Candidatus Dormibacteraeota bacterium]|nr:hypothetical protein [Candidatus Dormibacteraeota bacterium]